MGWPEFFAHIQANPYPNPIILGGVIVAFAFSTWDLWQTRR